MNDTPPPPALYGTHRLQLVDGRIRAGEDIDAVRPTTLHGLFGKRYQYRGAQRLR